MLSCALYEAHNLRPLLHEPSLQALLRADERDARDGLNALSPEMLDDLLTLHEAHAALRHLLCTTSSAPRADEPGWLELRRLLALAKDVGSGAEAHFLALEDVDGLKAYLNSKEPQVPSLVRLLDWASPQAAVHLRTRGARAEGE